MITIGLAALALVSATPKLAPVAISVIAPHDVSDSLVNRICGEAEAIWAPAGIALEWNREGSSAGAHSQAIVLTIDDRRPPAGRTGALGWLSFTGDEPDRVIHLSRASAEDLLRGTPGLNDGTIASHESLVGRALGRALAHEFGHYSLRSKLHAAHGLMRADWSSVQAFAVNRDGFELTRQEQETAAAFLKPGGH